MLDSYIYDKVYIYICDRGGSSEWSLPEPAYRRIGLNSVLKSMGLVIGRAWSDLWFQSVTMAAPVVFAESHGLIKGIN